MLEKKTDIGVLVTEAMPLGMERFGLKDGIWICSFEEFKGLCTVLRESIIKISATITTRAGIARSNRIRRISTHKKGGTPRKILNGVLIIF